MTRKPVISPIAQRIHQRLQAMHRSRRWLGRCLGVPNGVVRGWFERETSASVPAVAIAPMAIVLQVDPLWLLCISNVEDPLPRYAVAKREFTTLRHSLARIYHELEGYDKIAKRAIASLDGLRNLPEAEPEQPEEDLG